MQEEQRTEHVHFRITRSDKELMKKRVKIFGFKSITDMLMRCYYDSFALSDKLQKATSTFELEDEDDVQREIEELKRADKEGTKKRRSIDILGPDSKYECPDIIIIPRPQSSIEINKKNNERNV